ncbi:MAG: hypothetical protein ACHQNE_00355 [Candidatus Kapaibacterium sp.]
MSIKKLHDGRYQVDYRDAKGKYRRKIFNTRKYAQRFLRDAGAERIMHPALRKIFTN